MINKDLNMTPKQRVLCALNGEDVDRPPVSNPTSVATVELMDYVGAPFPDACRDANLNAQLAITGYTELGFDSIAPYFSIIQESSALGCEMQWEQKDNWPTVRMNNPIWKDLKGNKERIDIIKYCIENLDGKFRVIWMEPKEWDVMDETRECLWANPEKKSWFKIRDFDEETGEFSSDNFDDLLSSANE